MFRVKTDAILTAFNKKFQTIDHIYPSLNQTKLLKGIVRLFLSLKSKFNQRYFHNHGGIYIYTYIYEIGDEIGVAVQSWL